MSMLMRRYGRRTIGESYCASITQCLTQFALFLSFVKSSIINYYYSDVVGLLKGLFAGTSAFIQSVLFQKHRS